jgi:hypothetical protein
MPTCIARCTQMRVVQQPPRQRPPGVHPVRPAGSRGAPAYAGDLPGGAAHDRDERPDARDRPRRSGARRRHPPDNPPRRGVPHRRARLERRGAPARPVVGATQRDRARRRDLGERCARVVWPAGVAAVVADERVAPERVFDELGNAVRRASHHAALRSTHRTQPVPPAIRRAAAVPSVERGPRPISPAPAWPRHRRHLDPLPGGPDHDRRRRSGRADPQRAPLDQDPPDPCGSIPHLGAPFAGAAGPAGGGAHRAVLMPPDPSRSGAGKSAGAVTSCGRGRPRGGRGQAHARSNERMGRGEPNGKAQGHTEQPRSGRGGPEPTPPEERGRPAGRARSTS